MSSSSSPSSRAASAAALLALALAALAGGCAGGQGEREARRSVDSFMAAFAARDGRRACELLTEGASSSLERSAGRPCEQAVLELELTPSDVAAVEVATVDAQALLEQGGAVFLDETSAGWRISALACEARPGRPYECELAA